jgi:hypothetical protein
LVEVRQEVGRVLPMREVILQEACSAIRQMAEVRAHSSGVWKGGACPFGTTLASRQESKRRVSMELLEKNATGGLSVEQVETLFDGLVDGGLKKGMMREGVVQRSRKGRGSNGEEGVTPKDSHRHDRINVVEKVQLKKGWQ